MVSIEFRSRGLWDDRSSSAELPGRISSTRTVSIRHGHRTPQIDQYPEVSCPSGFASGPLPPQRDGCSASFWRRTVTPRLLWSTRVVFDVTDRCAKSAMKSSLRSFKPRETTNDCAGSRAIFLPHNPGSTRACGAAHALPRRRKFSVSPHFLNSRNAYLMPKGRSGHLVPTTTWRRLARQCTVPNAGSLRCYRANTAGISSHLVV